eukprot:7837068-Pyramimonas_sp.AAC.1
MSIGRLLPPLVPSQGVARLIQPPKVSNRVEAPFTRSVPGNRADMTSEFVECATPTRRIHPVQRI